MPSTPWVLHGFDASSGPMNISYNRTASAPNASIMSSGFTTLPTDFDIFAPSSPKIVPWWISRLNGSGVLTTPISNSTLCQKRA